MQQAQRHRRDGRGGHELATATVSATHVLVVLDAVHEGLDRFHHDRIGCWRRECRARLRQFRRLAGRAEQAVMSDTFEALG